MNILKTLLFVCMSVLFIFTDALANEIKDIRAHASREKTRIVFDMQSIPKYKATLLKDKLQYEIRILDVNNSQKKFPKLNINKSSMISGVKRGVTKNAVVYIFTMKEKVEPSVFALAANNSQSARLVVDFPTKVKSLDNSKEKNNKKTELTKISNTQELEAAIFADLNSESDNLQPIQNVESRLNTKEVPNPVLNKNKNNRTCHIVIDPGHGGKDPGAIGKRGLKEKNVTLGISKDLYGYVKNDPNMKGFLTRSNDGFIELGERSEIARKYEAHFLISIHADSAANSQAQGASILVLSGQRANREKSKIEKNKTKQEALLGGAGDAIKGRDDIPYFAKTIIDLRSDDDRENGYNLAKKILDSMGKSIHLRKKQPIYRSLAVLKAPDIPSLLIETGYLSNLDEERLLSTSKYQKQIAYLIYKGLKEYVEENINFCKLNDAQKEEYYVVQKGDYLEKIAKKTGTTVLKLKELNKLKSNNIKPGQKLLVKR